MSIPNKELKTKKKESEPEEKNKSKPLVNKKPTLKNLKKN